MIDPIAILIGFFGMVSVIGLGFLVKAMVDWFFGPHVEIPFEPPIIPKKTVHYPRQLTKKERKRNPKQYTTLYKENPNG